jgi:hypothetical protein
MGASDSLPTSPPTRNECEIGYRLASYEDGQERKLAYLELWVPKNCIKKWKKVRITGEPNDPILHPETALYFAKYAYIADIRTQLTNESINTATVKSVPYHRHTWINNLKENFELVKDVYIRNDVHFRISKTAFGPNHSIRNFYRKDGTIYSSYNYDTVIATYYDKQESVLFKETFDRNILCPEVCPVNYQHEVMCLFGKQQIDDFNSNFISSIRYDTKSWTVNEPIYENGSCVYRRVRHYGYIYLPKCMIEEYAKRFCKGTYVFLYEKHINPLYNDVCMYEIHSIEITRVYNTRMEPEVKMSEDVV